MSSRYSRTFRARGWFTPMPRRLHNALMGMIGCGALATLMAFADVDRPTNTPAPVWQSAHVLRVCSDPNNMPFSNQREEGFENKLAEMIARDIGAKVSYVWYPQRRGFIKHALAAKLCDVVMGIPAHYDMVFPTAPYYRSTYVFVTRQDRHLHIHSLDDPQLRHLKIGVHTIGDDYANPPAVQALAERGIVKNVAGYSIYGDYSKPDPPADLVRAVARGDVDVAIVWGPLAGYFAKHTDHPLQLTDVEPEIDRATRLPFAFDIAAGVRHRDTVTHTMLQHELIRRQGDIKRLLDQYGVPTLALPSASSEAASSGTAAETSALRRVQS